MECFEQAYFAQLRKKNMHSGIKNIIGMNIRRTSIARLTGMAKQAQDREHQKRGDLSKTFWI